jgi:putative membrane protein
MNYRTFLLTAALALAGAAANADVPVTGAGLKPAENPDASFINEAGLDNLAGVELGRLALDSAHSPAVRDFARELVEAHDRSLKELRLVAARQKLTPPTELDAERAQRLAELDALEGDDFDAAFLDTAADEHRKLIAVLERAQGTSSDNSVRLYARKQLMIARDHLDTAESIHLR